MKCVIPELAKLKNLKNMDTNLAHHLKTKH